MFANKDHIIFFEVCGEVPQMIVLSRKIFANIYNPGVSDLASRIFKTANALSFVGRLYVRNPH